MLRPLVSILIDENEDWITGNKCISIGPVHSNGKKYLILGNN